MTRACLLDDFLMMHMCVPGHFSYIRLFVTLWAVAHQAPLSMGFSRQEHWSGLPCRLQGIFPTWGLNPHPLCFLHCRQILYPLSTGEEALS